MRSRLVSVGLGAVLMVLFVFAGTAAAAPVSGSVADEQDARPEVLQGGGVRYNPDLKSLSVSYDSPTGSITATVELWRSLGYDGTWQWGQVSFALGSHYRAAGDCVADTPGDPTMVIYLNGSSPYWPNAGSAATFRGYDGSASGSAVAVNLTTFTATVVADPAKNRAYTCVRDVRLDASGADEARGFCLGACPPPPQPPAGGDTRAPTVRWVSPRDNEVVSGIFTEAPGDRAGWHTCLVDARDDVGIDHTDNYVDGVFHDRQVSPAYSCEWDTREVPDGRHTLTVVAYDRAGNSARSTITVTVRNAGVRAPTPAAPPAALGTPGAPGAPLTPPPSGGGGGGGRAALAGRITGARTLRTLARQGLRVRVQCPAACRASVRLTVSRRLARSLETETTLARGARRLSSAGTVRLRPPRRAVARRLLRRSRLTATLRVVATQTGGETLRLQQRVTLRR
jgi:hypothetical protein